MLNRTLESPVQNLKSPSSKKKSKPSCTGAWFRRQTGKTTAEEDNQEESECEHNPSSPSLGSTGRLQ